VDEALGSEAALGFPLLALADFAKWPDGPVARFAGDGHYSVAGPSKMKVEGGRLVLRDAGTVPASAFLEHRETVVPRVVAGDAVFSGGRTSAEEFVLVSSQASISVASVQFFITPDRWALLTVTRGKRHRVAHGKFRAVLKRDGSTPNRIVMRIDPSTSVVTVQYPGGQGHWHDADFARYWGSLFSVQIIRPHTSDGTVAILGTASGA
jgi:hypothetical protein